MDDQQILSVINANGGNFRANEFLNGRENLTKKIIEQLTIFRNWHGYPTLITSAYRLTGSHRLGTAIDQIIWKKWRVNQPDPIELWNIATTFPWHGVGLYFDWHLGIGLHTDLVAYSQRERPLRWIRVNHQYYYQRFDGYFYSKITGQRKSLDDEIARYKDKKRKTV